MGGRNCSICEHPDLAAISKALAHGGSRRSVAARFGVGDAAVGRHKVNCMRIVSRPKKAELSPLGATDIDARGLVRFDDSKAISTPADLLERLQSLFRLTELLEDAYSRKDTDGCVKLSREIRSNAESYARLAGWLNEETRPSNDNRSVTNVFAGMPLEEVRAILRALQAPKPAAIEGEIVGGSVPPI
jgi:hypothetical protein